MQVRLFNSIGFSDLLTPETDYQLSDASGLRNTSILCNSSFVTTAPVAYRVIGTWLHSFVSLPGGSNQRIEVGNVVGVFR